MRMVISDVSSPLVLVWMHASIECKNIKCFDRNSTDVLSSLLPQDDVDQSVVFSYVYCVFVCTGSSMVAGKCTYCVNCSCEWILVYRVIIMVVIYSSLFCYLYSVLLF